MFLPGQLPSSCPASQPPVVPPHQPMSPSLRRSSLHCTLPSTYVLNSPECISVSLAPLKSQRPLSLTSNDFPGEVPEPAYKDDVMKRKREGQCGEHGSDGEGLRGLVKGSVINKLTSVSVVGNNGTCDSSGEQSFGNFSHISRSGAWRTFSKSFQAH